MHLFGRTHSPFQKEMLHHSIPSCDVMIVCLYVYVIWKPEGKRPLGRPRRRWEDNIGMDFQEVGLGYEDWIGLAQDRDRWRALVSAVRNLRVP